MCALLMSVCLSVYYYSHLTLNPICSPIVYKTYIIIILSIIYFPSLPFPGSFPASLSQLAYWRSLRSPYWPTLQPLCSPHKSWRISVLISSLPGSRSMSTSRVSHRPKTRASTSWRRIRDIRSEHTAQGAPDVQ